MANKVLFVCNRGENRSPKAVEWYRDKCKELYGVNIGDFVRSAGIDAGNRCRQLTQEHVDWADKIFAMDKSVSDELTMKYKDCLSKTIALGIPDDDYGEGRKYNNAFDMRMQIAMRHQMDRGCIGIE